MPQALKTRRKSRLAKAAVVVGSVAALTAGLSGSAFAAAPAALPSKATADEWKWLPAFDYDTDSCYPSVAIGRGGAINGGLRPSGSMTGGCRHLDNNNSYSRVACKNGWCAYMYALYFEKDQGDPTGISDIVSHRHDWESVILWVQNGKAKYASVSAHGGYKTYWWRNVPGLNFGSTQARVVYHKDGGGTHAFRLAKADEENHVENSSGKWHRPPLIGWNGYPAGYRDKLVRADFGRANFPLKDGNFTSNLNKARPAAAPTF